MEATKQLVSETKLISLDISKTRLADASLCVSAIIEYDQGQLDAYLSKFLWTWEIWWEKRIE